VGFFEDFIGVNFWTALFVLLNTLTIYFVAKKFLFKPVMKIIQDRQQEIDDMYSEAEKTKEEASALEKEYKAKLSNAVETSERMVREAVARSQSRKEEILQEASEEAAALMDKANAEIALEKKKALNNAKNEISVIAMAIAGKVVGREINGEDQAKLVDSFIDELGEQV